MMKKNDRELRELFSLSGDAVLGIRDGRVVFSNAAASARFGECEGRLGSELLPACLFAQEEERFVCTLPGTDEALTVTAAHIDGLLLLLIPRREEAAEPIPGGALAEMGTMAYNMRMASELILDRAPVDEKLTSYAAILHHNYYSMLRLVRNLSDIAALRDGELTLRKESVDLRVLYERLMDSAGYFLRERKTKLSFTAAEGEYLLHGDRERLEQLLLNLLSNALSHTDASGEIHVKLSRQGSSIVLAVDDNGSGMDASELSRLFSSGDDSRIRSGARLGLRVVQGIVNGHGGTLMLQSEAGKGTRVRVMLPAGCVLSLRDADKLPAGPGLILTELSGVLSHTAYEKRHLD